MCIRDSPRVGRVDLHPGEGRWDRRGPEGDTGAAVRASPGDPRRPGPDGVRRLRIGRGSVPAGLGDSKNPGMFIALRTRGSCTGARSASVCFRDESPHQLLGAGLAFDQELLSGPDAKAVSYTHLTLPTILRV